MDQQKNYNDYCCLTFLSALPKGPLHFQFSNNNLFRIRHPSIVIVMLFLWLLPSFAFFVCRRRLHRRFFGSFLTNFFFQAENEIFGLGVVWICLYAYFFSRYKHIVLLARYVYIVNVWINTVQRLRHKVDQKQQKIYFSHFFSNDDEKRRIIKVRKIFFLLLLVYLVLEDPKAHIHSV